MESITQEQVEAVLAKVSSIKETLAKVDEMLADLSKCSGNSTKALIFSVVKKQLTALGIAL